MKNKSIKNYVCVLRPALRQAYKNKLIPDNPYEFISALKGQKPILSYYDKNELSKFFDAMKKPTEKSKVQDDIDLLKNVKKNMLELGFDNLTEYFAYLDSVAEKEEEQELY